MSSKMFKPDSLKREQRGARYKPGVKVDCRLADELFALYKDDTLNYPILFAHVYEGYFKKTLELVRNCIKPFEGDLEHHRTVLDQLVTRLYMGGGAPCLQKVSNIFCAAVQALYELEHNDFLVDLSPITAFHDSETLYRLGNDFGRYLKGGEGNLLKMECRGNFTDVCEESRYCAVELSGTAVNVAKSADNVVLASLGPTGFAGEHAVECELYVRSQDSVVKNGWKNSFYVHDSVTDEFLRSLEVPLKTAVGEKDFFERGNRILVPDSSGGWGEVER